LIGMSHAKPPRVPTLSRALVAPRYVLSTGEFITTFFALLLVFGRGPTFLAVVAGSIAPVIVLFVSRHVFEHARRIVPIEQLARRGLQGELSPAERMELGEALVTLPRRVIRLRLITWAVSAVVLVATSSAATGLGWSDALAVIGVCMGVTLVFLMGRAQWFRRAAERAILPALSGADQGRYLGRTVRERLFVAAYLPIAVGALLAWLYDWLFLQLPLYGVRGVFEALPPLALFLTITFAICLFQWTVLLRGHLAGRPLHGEGDGPWKLDKSQQDPGPAAALRIATALPYRAAALSLALWALCAILVGVEHAAWYGPWQEGVLLSAGLMAVAVLAALLQITWSRVVLQPARELCARELGTVPLAALWPQVRVRDRFIATMAAVFFAASTFAYTTLYLQHRAIMSAAAGAEARVALDALWPKLEPLAALSPAARLAAIAQVEATTLEPLFLVSGGRIVSVKSQLRVTPQAADDMARGEREVPLHASRRTVALRPLTAEVFVGVARSWRNFEGAYSVTGLTLLFVVLGVVAFAITLIAADDITGPLKALRSFARKLGQGDLDAPLPMPDPDEVGELGLTLDKMRVDLRAQLRAVTELNQSLERKVEERTTELQHALKELHATQAQMVHGEKMASVGRLSAGVAHEINNPLNFIANALGPMESTLEDVRAVMTLAASGDPGAAQRERERRQLDGSLEELDDLMRLVKNGVQRTQQIVRGLRDFARRDEGEQRRETDVAALCDQTVALLRHEITGRIEVFRDFAPDSKLVCFPGAMGQLLMNLIANAAQAIPGRGQITLKTHREAGHFEIEVTDTGAGIAPETVSKIFDPFFTTKEVGRGSGLGLSIAHGIVERHGGRISVESALGVGTTFRVLLPVAVARELTLRAS
jgi:signal transduction histidine kinase